MATVKTNYLHLIDGRLRVKLEQVKRSPDTADRVRTQLLQIDGVTEVSANPTTGSVLVHYESQRVAHGEILRSLGPFGFAGEPSSPPERQQEGQREGLVSRVAEELAVAGCTALLKFGFRALAAAAV